MVWLFVETSLEMGKQISLFFSSVLNCLFLRTAYSADLFCIYRSCSGVGWCGGQWSCSAMHVTRIQPNPSVLSFLTLTLMEEVVTIIFSAILCKFPWNNTGINGTQGNNY